MTARYLAEYFPSQIAHPTATTSSGGWTAIGAASLHAAVSEINASDAERDMASQSAADTMILKLGSMSTPHDLGCCQIDYRIQVEATQTLLVSFWSGSPLSGGTKIHEWTHISGSVPIYTTFTRTLTAVEAGNVTNWADTYLQFVAN